MNDDFTQNTLCYYMPGRVADGNTEEFPCKSHIRGRYVSIQRLAPYGPYSEQLNLCEVQVFQTGEQVFQIC